MDRGAWWAAVHGVTERWTQLSIASTRVFLMTQQVKGLPAVQETQETWVRSLGREGPLEKEMATHPRILAWETP